MATATAFERLTPAQRQAAQYGARDEKGAFVAAPLLIIDGASTGPLVSFSGGGPGKTNTLATRFAALGNDGVCPDRILLLTFSRSGALDMTPPAHRIVGIVIN